MDTLTTQTPAQIDTQLADIYRKEQRAENDLIAAVIRAHHAAGDKERSVSRNRKVWGMTDADAVAKAREIADPDAHYTGIPGPSAHAAYKAITAYNAAEAALAALQAEAKPLNAEFARRGGWSRFFIVQNNNGHIHSSMSCSTCNHNGNATRFGWNPELSGKTEAEAVAELGPMMCTVCFPSAPVEWTIGREQTAEDAAKDGKCINREATNLRLYGMSYAGDCDACGARGVAATANGLRKHEHAAMAKEAAATARKEDPNLIGAPGGGVLRVDGDTIKTVRTAEIKYVDSLWWAHYSKVNGSDPAENERWARVVAEALAAKFGTTVEAQVERLAARAAKKIARDFK